jgi:RNA polymerase sigma factor (sigma-70 family)
MAVAPTHLRADAAQAGVDPFSRPEPLADRGDPSARVCHGLYERHSQRLLRYCLVQLGGQRQEAEDAVQITFLHAWRALQRGERPRSEGAWLYRIARNVCSSRRRELRRTRWIETIDPQLLTETVATVEAEPVDVSYLRDALAGLPDPQRQALLLREWQGLSYREIAEQMNRSVANVETLIFRARGALSTALDAELGSRRRGRLASAFGIVDILRHWQAFACSAVPTKALSAGVVAGALAVTGTYGVGRAVVPDHNPKPASGTAVLRHSDGSRSASPQRQAGPGAQGRGPLRRESPPSRNGTEPQGGSTAQVTSAAGAADVPQPAPGRPGNEPSESALPGADPGTEPTDTAPGLGLGETASAVPGTANQAAEDTIDDTIAAVEGTIDQVTESVPALEPIGPIDGVVDGASDVVPAVDEASDVVPAVDEASDVTDAVISTLP